MTIEPVRAEARVALLQKDAFEAFTHDIADWWPLTYTMSGGEIALIAVDPDAREWFEEDGDGRRVSWGEIVAWDPPHRFTATFAVSPQRAVEPPERRSEVAIRFIPDGLYTVVAIDHHGLEKHGDGAQAMRDGMASAQGWPVILAEFASEARRRGSA